METREWLFMDRSTWRSGEWNGEPDKAQWPDPATGLPCLAHRGPSGAWCGYVGVPGTHPLFGVEYGQETDVLSEAFAARMERPVGDLGLGQMLNVLAGRADSSPEMVFECHGGLTFTGKCREVDENGRGVCHVAGLGEADPVWWFGFDCSHYGDASPASDFLDGSYKSLPYVKREVTELAAQIGALTDAPYTGEPGAGREEGCGDGC